MGIGGIGYPDVDVLLGLIAPLGNNQTVEGLVEDAVNKQNKMTERLMRLAVRLKVEGLGDNVDLYI